MFRAQIMVQPMRLSHMNDAYLSQNGTTIHRGLTRLRQLRQTTAADCARIAVLLRPAPTQPALIPERGSLSVWQLPLSIAPFASLSLGLVVSRFGVHRTSAEARLLNIYLDGFRRIQSEYGGPAAHWLFSALVRETLR